MNGILAISRNTFKEAIRDKILYMFLAFAVILIIGSRFISMMTIGDNAKIIKDIGMFAIQVFGMLITVMMTVMMVQREFEQRTIFTILSKPVSRLQYLLGKYIGLMMIIATMIALMSAVMILIVFIYSLQLDLMMLFAGLMTALEMAMLCSLAILFATITKPILGTVITLASFVVGHLTGALLLLKDRLEDSISQVLIPIFYYILPNLEVFNFKTEIVHGLDVPWAAVAWSAVYALIYIILIMLIAWLQFNGKDIE
jgi:ABC-type transport system involved in multi-copper enzyme maturation permease subunit